MADAVVKFFEEMDYYTTLINPEICQGLFVGLTLMTVVWGGVTSDFFRGSEVGF